MVYYEFCRSTTHTTKKCHALDALANRIDLSSFNIDEAPQGFGGGRKDGGDFIGGRTGGRGPTSCYNYDE